MLARFVARQSLHVAEKRIRVERFVDALVKDLAVISLGSAPGHHANLHRAFAAGVRAQPRGRNADFLDCVNAGRGKGEKAGAAALKALRIVVHAIERDVERGVGQAIERAISVARASGTARDQHGEVQTFPPGVGQVLNQLVVDRAADFGRRGVELFRNRRHLDGFRRGADFKLN